MKYIVLKILFLCLFLQSTSLARQNEQSYSLTIYSIPWMTITKTRIEQSEIIELNSSSKSVTILFNPKMIKELKEIINENYSEICDSTYSTADDIDYRIVCLIKTPFKIDTLSYGKPRIMVYNNRIVKFNNTVFDIIADQLPSENKEEINRIKLIWKVYQLDDDE